MKCENCGKNEANVKYTQIINGEKKQMFLCEECSEKLGINNNIHLNMPIDFSSFLGDFFDDMNEVSLIPSLENDLKCETCGLTFDDFMHTGKFGCSNCYEAFESKIDPLLKNIQGSNRHVGRLGIIKENEKSNEKIDKKTVNEENTKLSKIERLKENLKNAIKEERYEDAAKIRDEIKKEEGEK